MTFLLAVLGVLFMCGCAYEKLPALVDAGPSICVSDLECSPLGVCDVTGMKTCVQCTTNELGLCESATPVCVDNQCQKCTEHAQCKASNVCLPDGSCADPSQVAYVQAGGVGSICTMAAPCGTLGDGVQSGRPIVKIAAGTVADTKTTTIDGKVVTILAEPGAKLSRANAGVILDIRNDGAGVQIFDLEITGGTGVTNPAIYIPSGGAPTLTLTRVLVDSNQGIGISVATGTLTMAQSTVSGNTGGGISVATGTLTMARSTISGNTGGGISISGAQYRLTNNIIAMNGSVTSAFGGVRIDGITVAGTYVFDFNTITANVGPATVVTGVACGTVLVPLTFSNNIIYANLVSGGGAQVGGSSNCSLAYSDIGPDTMTGSEPGNINVNPMFVNPLQNDFHLMGTSPARDAADPAATLADDIDGDPRPQGTRRDMGADEIKP